MKYNKLYKSYIFIKEFYKLAVNYYNFIQKDEMELQRGGFTIIELVISVTIMFIVIVAAFPILFKKATTTTEIPKSGGSFVCSCINSTNGECTFVPDDAFRQEFYTIQLVGGGAGGGLGSGKKGGGAGDGKDVYYPSLPVDKDKNTQYKIKLGEGGDAGKNGGQTTFYRVEGSNIEVLEYAKGGITTNENAEEVDGILETSGQYSKYSENGCGRGGDAMSGGTMGEVIIRW